MLQQSCCITDYFYSISTLSQLPLTHQTGTFATIATISHVVDWSCRSSTKQ